MKITAYTAFHPKEALQPQERLVTELQPEQVMIAVTHCGVCHSDTDFIDDKWHDSQFPLVPGHEIVGEVIAKGEQVTTLQIGERVGVSWQQGACLDCEWCNQGKEEFCQQLQAVCLGCQGGFADRVVVDSRFVYQLPENIPSALAAPLLCAGATVFHALTVHHLKPGMRVGIIGLGGLGHLAVQFAVAMGYEVSVFSPFSEQVADANELGASHFILNTDKIAMQAQKASLDFILSTIYVDLDYQAYIDMLRPEGRLCFAGMPEKPVAVSVFSLIIGQKSVCGVPLGNRASVKAMLAFVAKHAVIPRVQLLPMSAVNEALVTVRAGKARYRIVLTNEIA